MWVKVSLTKNIRRLYVPLMTCFYSGLRKMNTDGEGPCSVLE